MSKSVKKRTYIWELKTWPKFEYDLGRLAPAMRAARRAQGDLLGMVKALSEATLTEVMVGAMARTAIGNNAIKSMDLSLESVRAFMMLRLCAAKGGFQPGAAGRMDPIAGMLAEAVRDFRSPLTMDRIFSWHRVIFPDGVSPDWGWIRVEELRGPNPIIVAASRRTPGKPDIILFEPPGRQGLEAQMETFLAWFNAPPEGLDGQLRAGIAHLWFLILHPLEDGNGRIARTITELALAQDEASVLRFYSISKQIMRNSGYKGALRHAQQGDLDITNWLIWFLQRVEEAALQAMEEVRPVLVNLTPQVEPKHVVITDLTDSPLKTIVPSGRPLPGSLSEGAAGTPCSPLHPGWGSP